MVRGFPLLSFRLAVRFLKAGGGQTVLIIIGIAVAIGAQIFVGLLIDSLQKTLIDRTAGHQPHITVTSATDVVTIRDWQTLVGKIKQADLVKTISVSVSNNAVIQKGTRVAPVYVRGLDAQADNIYGLTRSVYLGKWSPSQQGILIGRDLEEDLNYNLGSYVLIKTSDGTQGNFRVEGFFDLGVASINNRWIITSLDTAQSFFGYNEYITSIEMNTRDLFQADTIAGQVKAVLNDKNLTVDNWKTQNSELLSGLQGQSLSSLMIQIFIIVAVVIAIAAILAITVFQKSRQLGILKAMGIKDRSASFIFLFEGLIIGLIAAVIGVGLGLLLFYGFTIGTTKPGEPPLVEAFINYQFIIISWIIAVASSVIAAFIPARRSLRLNPIDVIREG
jgi:lipoprotein-releasing system permease protein